MSQQMILIRTLGRITLPQPAYSEVAHPRMKSQ
jgi:hypothetical protein